MDNNHSTLHFYHNHLRNLSRASIIQQRLQLFNSFNGDAFYPLSVWPQEFKLIFWKKPISDENTFKLFLFLIGNGCSPHLTSHWIMTSQYWTTDKKVEKRARQLDLIFFSTTWTTNLMSGFTLICTAKNGYTSTDKKDLLTINDQSF